MQTIVANPPSKKDGQGLFELGRAVFERMEQDIYKPVRFEPGPKDPEWYKKEFDDTKPFDVHAVRREIDEFTKTDNFDLFWETYSIGLESYTEPDRAAQLIHRNIKRLEGGEAWKMRN